MTPNHPRPKMYAYDADTHREIELHGLTGGERLLWLRGVYGVARLIGWRKLVLFIDYGGQA